MQSISVQHADFDVSEEILRLKAGRQSIGAVVSFTGHVRGGDEGGIDEMMLEHYPGMTEKALDDIAAQATRRWELQGVRIVHRVGTLRPGEQIVLVLTASAHRGDAFEAAEFIMDYLKSRAPFWKKEMTAEGGKWVDARETDETALERWKN